MHHIALYLLDFFNIIISFGRYPQLLRLDVNDDQHRIRDITTGGRDQQVRQIIFKRLGGGGRDEEEKLINKENTAPKYF